MLLLTASANELAARDEMLAGPAKQASTGVLQQFRQTMPSRIESWEAKLDDRIGAEQNADAAAAEFSKVAAMFAQMRSMGKELTQAHKNQAEFAERQVCTTHAHHSF